MTDRTTTDGTIIELVQRIEPTRAVEAATPATGARTSSPSSTLRRPTVPRECVLKATRPVRSHSCDSLGFDSESLYGMYDRVPSIEAKDDFVADLTRVIDRGDIVIETDEDLRDFIRDLVGFYVVMEGICFYAGFAMMLELKRQSKLVGIGQQFEYVEHVADRRLGQLDLPEQYGTDNPFPWMSEQVDLDKEKNFFETQVTEYRSGASLDW